MRHQDRLVSSLSHQDLHYRAYAARQMERLCIYFDSEDLIGTVRSSWHEAPGPMAVHYLCAYNDLLPRHLRSLYEPGRSLVHSRVVSSAGRSRPGAGSTRPDGQEALTRAANQATEPCIQALRKRIDGVKDREKRVLMGTLSRFRHTEVEACLTGMLGDDSFGAIAAFLLTANFGILADDKVLGRIEQVWDRDLLPQYILPLRYLPTEGSFDVLKRAAAHKSPAVQWLTATCLDRYGDHDLKPVVETLFQTQLGWAIVHSLESLARLGRSKLGLPFVKQALESFEHPLVRIAALKALVEVGGGDSLDICLKEIGRPGSSHQVAQAMTSFLQLGAPPELRCQVFAPLLKSSNLEVTTQAILGLIGADDQLAGRGIRDLIVEGSEDERLQAAYCLGYYPGESSVRVLDHLIRTDASPAVRLQALRACAYYEPTDFLLERLISYLDLEEDRLVMDAIRILSNVGGECEKEVIPALATVARYGGSGPLRRLANRGLGQFETRLARSHLEEALSNDSSDPDSLLGAIEGLGWASPPAPDTEGLVKLLDHPLASIRAASARVLYGWANLDGLAVLPKLLEGSGSEAREAVRAMEEISVINDYLLMGPRFASLAEKLKARLRTSEYLEFSRRELQLGTLREGASEAVDPHEAVQSRTELAADGLAGEGRTASQLLADIEEAQKRYPTADAGRRRKTATQAHPPVPGPEDRLSTAPERWRWLVPVAGVCAGALIFAVLGKTLTSSGGGESLSPEATETQEMEAFGQSLAIGSIRGVVRSLPTGGGNEEVLGPDSRVNPGDRVEADDGGAIQLGLKPKGNALFLQGPGGFSFSGLAVESAERRLVLVRVSDIQGRLVFDLKWGRPRVELVLGNFRIKAWKGLYSISNGPKGAAVSVAAGRVEVTDKLDQYTLVTENQEFRFLTTDETGKLADFDPSTVRWR